ncbi:flagellar brake protein [Candidatus Burkholderia verschuerenii]|nr:flagellar brake protein [Candidatus Burkholderia verschuerenii]
MPLDWPIVAADGALLFDTGTVIPDEAARQFLFQQFEPHRPADHAGGGPTPGDGTRDDLLTLEHMGLNIGARVGMRGTGTSGSSMYASRVIGFSHARRNGERSLFLTQPQMQGHGPIDLSRGEQVELVALTGKGVFRFMCTVDATSREPFSYVVLSAPGAIRRLRTRKFARMPTRLAARFSPEGDGAEQLARVGDRLQLSFHFNTDGTDVQVDTIAIVRHVGEIEAATGTAAYGLEFEALEPSQRIALKSFMAEHS